MEKLKPQRAIFALVTAAVTIWSFTVPDAKDFLRPELARIFFWHFPCPMMLTGLLFTGVYFALRHFGWIKGKAWVPEENAGERRRWDMRAEAALEMGFVFGILTMITGIFFSLAQWGSAWQWDPRQTSFLIVLVIYGAYFAIRNAFDDPERRAAYSGAYMMAAFFPLLFLIFVFPRLPQVKAVSFHPNDTVMSGNLKGQYLYVTLALLTLVTILTVWLYRLRVRVGELELLTEDYGTLETRGGHPTSTGVVRPVSISEQS